MLIILRIFHPLSSSSTTSISESLKLQRNINKYEILKDTNADDDDKTQFYYTKKSLECLGFTGDEILSVFKIIAVVLKLGNLNFIPITNIDGTEGCEITNDYGECEKGRWIKKNCDVVLKQRKKALLKIQLYFSSPSSFCLSLSLFHFPPFILSLFCWLFELLKKYIRHLHHGPVAITPQKFEILHSS